MSLDKYKIQSIVEQKLTESDDGARFFAIVASLIENRLITYDEEQQTKDVIPQVLELIAKMPGITVVRYGHSDLKYFVCRNGRIWTP